MNTTGGFAGVYMDQVSIGYSVDIEFLDNSHFTISKNGNEVISGRFFVTVKDNTIQGDGVRCISFPKQTEKEIEEQFGTSIIFSGLLNVVEGQTIYIGENVYDGFGSTFANVEYLTNGGTVGL